MKFSIKDFFSNCDPQFSEDFPRFTKEFLNWKPIIVQQWCDVIFYCGCLLLFKIKETTLAFMDYGKVDRLLE